MTADQVFDSVIALMFAEAVDKSDYQAGFLAQLNMKLEELFALNNGLREKKGMQPLKEPPWIAELSDEIPYEFEVTRSLLPLGIAGDLFVEDDETGISNDYRQRYQNGLYSRGVGRFTPCGPGEV